MENLSRYVTAFDEAYPDYADARYFEIVTLVARLGFEGVSEALDGSAFAKFVSLVQPLIAIKNYKSQVPFPMDLSSVLKDIVRLKRWFPQGEPLLNNEVVEVFGRLISREGFQLPTVSAVFHFCHPSAFPIVDRNVKSACQLLKTRYPDDFEGMDAPELPYPNTSPENKMEKYRAFAGFLSRVIALQQGDADYRYIDKALMVLGVEKLRNLVE